MQNVLIFLFGLAVGAGMFMGYGWYQMNKIKKVKDLLMNQIRQKAAEMDGKRDSIKDRLVKASELAQDQASIRAQIEMPSKNALHSRHKNGLVAELQDLEQQKLDLLKTVLAEGFDPTITVINESGARQEIPLSTYVNQATVALNDSLGTSDATPPPAPEDNQPKKVGKFIIYKGGKDDGTTH
jgi:hypothetical protein